MKNYKIISVLLLIFTYSCNQQVFFEYTENDEFEIKKILNLKNVNLECLGSFGYDKNYITSVYNIDDEQLFVVKVQNFKKKSKINCIQNKPFEYSNAVYSVIEGQYVDFDYNVDGLNKTDAKGTINFCSDGLINEILTTSNLSIVETQFSRIYVYFDENSEDSFHLTNSDSKQVNANARVAFYNCESGFYIMLFTSSTSQVTHDKLLSYFAKEDKT